MLSPEEVRVRESLFSSVSSDQAWATSRGVSGRDGVGGDSHDSYGCVPTAEGTYARQSPRSSRLTANDQRAGTQRTTATAASTAYIPNSSVSRSGWKGQRGRPWRSVFSRKPRSSRRAIVAAPWTSPVAAHHLAAVQIQRHVRGFIANTSVARHGTINRAGGRNAGGKTEADAATRRRRGSGRRRSRAGGSTRQLDKYLRHVAEDEAARGSGGGGDRRGAGGGYSEWCGRRIQAWWRMVDARFRFRYLKFPLYGLAALQIQYAWRNYQQNTIYDMSTREIVSDECLSSLERGSSLLREDGECSANRQQSEGMLTASLESCAAKTIQTCWRNRVSKSIYRYYRNVIDFRLGGDPRLLLRAINPGEAALFDRAAGVHVRFRLGGYTFPPSIYYKVYTHQPVADIGAFAPRAYSEDAKDTPADRWNHPPMTGYPENPQAGQIRVGASYFGTAVKRTGPQGTRNWYRRHENNGWRPITIKALSSAEDDPVTIDTAKKHAARSGSGGESGNGLRPSGGGGGGGFHYSKVVREECRAARMKRRKRRWLMSMYSAGIAETAAAAAAAGGGGGAEAEGTGTAASYDGGPFSHQSRQNRAEQMQQQRGRNDHHHSRGGMGGRGAPGWEEGGDWGVDWDWEGSHRQQGNTAAGREGEDDAALLVRWSKAL
ncbi:unnamed protein product, partial [Ectocarpus fasciculatus]